MDEYTSTKNTQINKAWSTQKPFLPVNQANETRQEHSTYVQDKGNSSFFEIW